MNLQPVSFYDLKPIDPAQDQRIARGREALTVNKKRVGISKSLFEKLGRPEKVEFVLEAEKNLLGIRTADPGSKFGFVVTLTEGGTSGYISAANLTGLLLGKRNVNGNSRYMILLEPWSDSGYYLFDIDKAYVKKIEKRNK